MKKVDDYTGCLNLLTELKQQYPRHSLGKHLSMALSEYGDCWGITDKEILYALTKYASQLDTEPDIKKIMFDGMHLDTILDDEEDD